MKVITNQNTSDIIAGVCTEVTEQEYWHLENSGYVVKDNKPCDCGCGEAKVVEPTPIVVETKLENKQLKK